jgi:hypothetical protein
MNDPCRVYEKPPYSAQVTVWYGMSLSGIIGLYFFEVTTQCNLRMISNSARNLGSEWGELLPTRRHLEVLMMSKITHRDDKSSDYIQ